MPLLTKLSWDRHIVDIKALE